jgi:hypothetical protein
MAAIPRMLRPSVLIRRKAVSAGFMGPSRFWKIVGVVVFGKSTIKKFLGKRSEVIDTSKLGKGRYMQLSTAQPVTRRELKKLREAGMEPPTLKQHKVLGKLWAASRATDRQARARRARLRDAS